MNASDFKRKDGHNLFVFGESKKELSDMYGVYVQEVEYGLDDVVYLKYSIPNKAMYGIFIAHNAELAFMLNKYFGI